MAREALLAVGVAGAALVALPPSVWATTGPSIALPPSRYTVGSQVAKLYVGAYELSSVARAARISTCALGIEVNRGFLFGMAQFYGYDLEGNQTLWVNELYNFHQTAKGVMVIDLLGPGGQPVMGRLFVTRSRRGDLSGRIELPLGTYTISWHKVSNGWTPTKG
jgi:hypothetical protein